LVDCVGHYGNDPAASFYFLSFQNFPLPSALLWDCALMLIFPV